MDDKTAICGSSNINDRVSAKSHLSTRKPQPACSATGLISADALQSQLGLRAQHRHGRHGPPTPPWTAPPTAPVTTPRPLARSSGASTWAQFLDAPKDPNAQPPGDNPKDNPEGPEFDFVADPLWDLWCRGASTNADVFRDLFHADPDDCIRSFDDYDAFTPNPKADKQHKQGHLYDMNRPMAEARRELDRIQGHLVWMPLRFLEDAEMAEKRLQVNVYTEYIYT